MNRKSIIATACFLALALFGVNTTYGQELRCQVTVNGQKINGVDPSIFQSMQTAINEFMNAKSWTQDQFGAEERIECSMFINIESSPSQDVYQARITIQSSRPVFNSSYSSPMFNFIDNDCLITYAQNQPIEFNPTQFNSNLSSILGFYAYVLIGLDYESLGKNGGAKYFAIAEQVMNAVPTNGSDAKGWRNFDGQRNRYWLINRIQSSKYDDFKKAIYEYHFASMDNFYDNPALARQNILDALDKLDKIQRDDPNCILLAIFFQAKSDELVNIFSGADMGEKQKALGYLRRIDPSNATKYDKLVKN